MHLKDSSAVIVSSTSLLHSKDTCHSGKKENALSFVEVEQMLFNFMKQKQTWKVIIPGGGLPYETDGDARRKF